MSTHNTFFMENWRKLSQNYLQLRPLSHHLNKLGRPWVHDVIYQDSAPKLFWFWRRRFLSVFTTYGHGNHIDWQTVTICKNFQFPFNRRLYMKFEENWPRSFREEVVQKYGQTDDRRQVITIAYTEHKELKKQKQIQIRLHISRDWSASSPLALCLEDSFLFGTVYIVFGMTHLILFAQCHLIFATERFTAGIVTLQYLP